MKNQNLTIKEIVEKNFKTTMVGGLKKADVDDFLNIIIEDYEFFIEKINILTEANEKLRDENFKNKMNILKTHEDADDFEEMIEQKTQDVALESETQKLNNQENDTEERLRSIEKSIEESKNKYPNR